ncbi:MAG: dephospho-CoA kinase [Bacillota bacterium]
MALGLTGGIATGKTTVAEILAELGAEIIDADKIAHRVLQPDGDAYVDVVAYFGRSILQENGEIDRKKLGEIVFSNKNLRQHLEKLTHPHIIARIKSQLKEIEDEYMAVLVAPLLYEAGLEDLVDNIWVVYASLPTQIKRLKERDGLSRIEATNRIDAQLSLDKKKERADKVIYNEGTKQELRLEVEEAWQDWLERRRT